VALWAERLPPGPARDAALAPLVYRSAETEPETAFRWAAGASGEEARFELVHHVLERWSSTAPERARAAALLVDLPPEKRAELLKSLNGEAPSEEDQGE
jgi:hypothetical protein